MAFHVPRSGIQGMMKKGTRYMDGKEEVVYDSIATIKGMIFDLGFEGLGRFYREILKSRFCFLRAL